MENRSRTVLLLRPFGANSMVGRWQGVATPWNKQVKRNNNKKQMIMKRTLLCTLCSLSLCGGSAWGQVTEGVYQIPNSGFEAWKLDNEPGNGWNSFASATGVYAGLKGMSPMPSKYTESHGGSLAVQIHSTSVLFNKNANGNLTTGIVNMGNTTPSNAANYNYTKRDDADHSLKFKGMPDAAECYAIFKSGGSPNGRLQFIIHGDINYCDPETSNGQQGNTDYLDYKVGSASILITECTSWTKFTAEFTYTGKDKTPQVHYMLASATTNPTPGGSAEDTLCLDDVRLIYYHSLSTCTYDNQSVVFDANNKAQVDALYDESKLAYEKKGVGATVEKSYDATTALLTITVKGNNYDENDNDTKTTYTIQFANPAEVIASKEYIEDLYVSVEGFYATPSSVPVTVETRKDGNINFLLNNFALELDGKPMYIGNIKVDALEVNDGKFTCQDKAVDITAGNLDGVAEDDWMGPSLSMIGVKASMNGRFEDNEHIKTFLTISFEGMNINVHLGYTPAIATMAVKEGRQYGTFYAPFAVTLPDGVKAYTCEAMEDNGYTLKLTPVESAIDAKTAIIVESTEAVSQNFYNFDEDLKLEDGHTGYLYGVAEGGKISAPIGSYVLQEQGDDTQRFYLVTEETGDLKVEANRCYLQIPADKAGVKAISFPGDATAIDVINALVSGKAEIYDLEGRRLPALQKGINVVNGRKVMVK